MNTAERPGLVTSEFKVLLMIAFVVIAPATPWVNPTPEEFDLIKWFASAGIAYIAARGGQKIMEARKPEIRVPVESVFPKAPDA